MDKWPSLTLAECENRKSDWPVRKRAEQKLHAEFSVGRSSIIGAEYRSVTSRYTCSCARHSLCTSYPSLSLSPSFPFLFTLFVFVSLSLRFHPFLPPSPSLSLSRTILRVSLSSSFSRPRCERPSLSLPFRNFTQGYLVNLGRRHRHLYGASRRDRGR